MALTRGAMGKRLRALLAMAAHPSHSPLGPAFTSGLNGSVRHEDLRALCGSFLDVR